MQIKTSLRAQREARNPQGAKLEPHLLSVEKIKQSLNLSKTTATKHIETPLHTIKMITLIKRTDNSNC